MKRFLIDNWREAHRLLSIWAGALVLVLPMAWAELPADIKAMIPDDWQPYIVSAMGLTVIVARLKRQNNA